MSCSRSGNCGCDAGLAITPGAAGADAPTITAVEVNPDNTITITLSDATEITSSNSIVVNNNPAILLYSPVTTTTVNLTTGSFAAIDDYAVDYTEYFTQNGDVLQFEMVFWHDQRNNVPEMKVEVGGQNISAGLGQNTALGVSASDYFQFAEPPGSANAKRGMIITGEITRRTNTTVLVDFASYIFGTHEDDSVGGTQDQIYVYNNKAMYFGHKELTVADLTANNLTIDLEAAKVDGAASDISFTLEKFNVKFYKLIT